MRNTSAPYEFPTEETTTYALLCVPNTLIPFFRYLFAYMQEEKNWKTREDWKQGYQAAAELEVMLMSNCVGDIIAELRALRGVKPAYAAVPVEERTTDMYRSIDDLVEHVNTLIFALSGGVEHEDNIMMILRGEVEASATRNIMEEL
jgi:hypothetical protein